jgi:hypothetical protein
LGFAASCGAGYFSPDLTTLGVMPSGTSSAYISPDLSYANTVLKSGYSIQMMGTASPTAPATCNGLAAGTASKSFKAGADPTGPTNYRYFALNSSNTIYEDTVSVYAGMPEVGVPPTGHPLR